MRAVQHAPRYTLTALAFALSIAGCSAFTPRPSNVPPGMTASQARLRAEFPLGADLHGPPASAGAIVSETSDPQFEASHPKVQGFVDAYQTSLRGYFSRALERSSKYLPHFASILAEEGVPPELAYLPIVESGFQINAVSHAGAVGPWQFIRGTGRRYGLRIDGYVDERRDPEKATRAAARYLRDLYQLFGDWHLSLAAYNTGEGNIARIRDRQRIEDYWEMSRRGCLPNETAEFVPRFLAAVEIAKSPEAYGFDVPQSRPVRYDEVTIDRSMSLRTVADLCSTSVSRISELNPALRRGMVPPSGYRIRIPKGSRQGFETAYAEWRSRPHPRPVAVASGTHHRVRRGETPSSIARRYGVSVVALMKVNGLRNARAMQVGRVLRIPTATASSRSNRAVQVAARDRLN